MCSRGIIGYSVRISLIAVAMIAASCTTRVDTNPVRYGGIMYPPPTAIRASSADGAIWLDWNRSPSWDSTGFGGYAFIVIREYPNLANDTISGIPADPNRTDTSYEIPNLSDDSTYTFIIRSIAALDGTEGPPSDSIHWAPARQFSFIQLYSDSVIVGIPVQTGLSFSLDSGVTGVATYTEPDSVDLLFSDSGGVYSLLPANFKGSTRHTYFQSSTGIPAFTLNDYALGDSVVDTNGWQSQPALLGDKNYWKTTLGGRGLVYNMRTYNGAYARVLVQPNTDSTLVTRDTLSSSLAMGYNYITVTVSYQQNTSISYSRMKLANTGKRNP